MAFMIDAGHARVEDRVEVGQLCTIEVMIAERAWPAAIVVSESVERAAIVDDNFPHDTDVAFNLHAAIFDRMQRICAVMAVTICLVVGVKSWNMASINKFATIAEPTGRRVGTATFSELVPLSVKL